MNGAALRKILTDNGYVLKELAQKMGMSQPGFSQLMKVKDVKSGILEQLCDILGKRMDFFYEGTPYKPLTKVIKESKAKKGSHLDVAPGDDADMNYVKGQLFAMTQAYKELLDRLPQALAVKSEKATRDAKE